MTAARLAGVLRGLCLLALCLLGGCSDTSSGETVLRFWAMGREGEVVRALLPAFEAENPGVRVEVQQIPWTAAHEKLLTAFAGDSLPDVAQIGNTWLPEFVALRAVEALPDPVADRSDYFPGIWDTNVIDGVAYGVPWYVDTRLLFYRRDILAEAGFTEPPKSWDAWLRAMLAIKRRVGPDRFAVLLPLNEYEPLLALALQQDDPLLRDDDSRGNFRSAGFKTALGFYKGMFDQGLAPRATSNQVANVWDEFARGFFTFYISGPWNIGEFKRRLPAELQGSWMTAPLPGPDGPGASIAGGSSLVVFSGSGRKDAAWKLVAYLSRPEVQVRFHALTGDLPPRRSAWDDPSLAGDEHARAFRDQLERVKPVTKTPEWERIATEMKVIGEQMVLGGRLSVDQAAAALDARADRILEKRRWLLAREP